MTGHASAVVPSGGGADGADSADGVGRGGAGVSGADVGGADVGGAGSDADRRLAARPRLLVGTLVYTGLTVAMIGTLGTPLVPTIARDQHVSFVAAQWILTSTLLVGSVATPTLGRLGDGPHRKLVLIGGLAAMLLGAVTAATAGTFPQLLVGRGLMGFGLGLMPLALAIARDCLPTATARSAIAVLSVTVATGSGLGYPLTGVIADHFDYRMGFWLAVALAAVAIALVIAVVPTADPIRPRRPFDLPGAVLLGAALGALLLGFSEAPSWGWASARVLGMFVGAVALAAGWLAVERSSRAPLVDLRYLAAPAVLVSNGVAVLMGFGMFGTVTLIGRLTQTPVSSGYGFGASVALTGVLIAPLSVGTLTATRAAKVVARRFGTSAVLLLGALATAAAGFGLAEAHGHLVEIACASALLGFGVGTSFAAMPALIIAHVPLDETGSATSFNQSLRTVGGSMGSALSAAVLAGFTPAGAQLPRDAGYAAAFGMLGAASVLAALLSLTLRRSERLTSAISPGDVPAPRRVGEVAGAAGRPDGAGAPLDVPRRRVGGRGAARLPAGHAVQSPAGP
jgi:predicted MFS family arabinose efflux permease